MVYAVETEFIAIFVLLDKAPLAAADGLERFKSHGQVTWTNPTGIEVRVRVGLEDQLAGCVKLTGNEELLFARFGSNHSFVLFLRHVISPFFEFPIKLRRGGRSSRSSTARMV